MMKGGRVFLPWWEGLTASVASRARSGICQLQFYFTHESLPALSSEPGPFLANIYIPAHISETSQSVTKQICACNFFSPSCPPSGNLSTPIQAPAVVRCFIVLISIHCVLELSKLSLACPTENMLLGIKSEETKNKC